MERHRSVLQEHACKDSMVHKRVLSAGFMCQRCPCISDDHGLFRQEECLGSMEVPSPTYGVAPASARPDANRMPHHAARLTMSIRMRPGKIGGEYIELPVVPPSNKGSCKGVPKATFGKQGMHASASSTPDISAAKEPVDAITTKDPIRAETKPEKAKDPIPAETVPEKAKDPIPTKTEPEKAMDPIPTKTEPPKRALETATEVATHKGWVDEPVVSGSPGKPMTHSQRIEVATALQQARAELDQLLLLHALESERKKLEKLLLMKADSEGCARASGGSLSKIL